MATRCVHENIKKARRCFFHFGSIGAFQGDISPLSSRFVIDLCVIPVLLFGCENWILTESLVKQLECFQGELAKRVLRWPKHHSNTAAVVVLGLPSVRYLVLMRKIGFLLKLM